LVKKVVYSKNGFQLNGTRKKFNGTREIPGPAELQDLIGTRDFLGPVELVYVIY
jgi:hypothetical protein